MFEFRRLRRNWPASLLLIRTENAEMESKKVNSKKFIFKRKLGDSAIT